MQVIHYRIATHQIDSALKHGLFKGSINFINQRRNDMVKAKKKTAKSAVKKATKRKVAKKAAPKKVAKRKTAKKAVKKAGRPKKTA